MDRSTVYLGWRCWIAVCLNVFLLMLAEFVSPLRVAAQVKPIARGDSALVVCEDNLEAVVPCGPLPLVTLFSPITRTRPRGFTSLSNPATGQFISRLFPPEGDDPFESFSRRPLDDFIIPEGGLFLDENYEGLHYGVDYANPDDYLNGQTTPVYPIGPGFVTARSACLRCFVDGDSQGRIDDNRWPEHNFGFGAFVLVETPYNAYVSIYTMYAHLNRDHVSLGDLVTPDEALGVVGSTGFAQEFHVHLEIRYGPPGRFWNADFSQWATIDRWLATMFANPALLVFPQNHPAFITDVAEWVALQPRAPELP